MNGHRLTLGSLFSGIGGLDLALEALGYEVAWHSENDKAASEVLARHWDVPNLGDITQVDWESVEPVDALAGGFPCQDISAAGKGAGINEGTRSGLWFAYARAIRHLRPRVVFVENVSALLGRGLDVVLADLAEAGYDAEWTCVPASAVGAPHKRERVFLRAVQNADIHARIDGLGERRQVGGDESDTGAPADASSSRRNGGDASRDVQPLEPPALDAEAPADPDRRRREQRQPNERGLPEPHEDGSVAPHPASGEALAAEPRGLHTEPNGAAPGTEWGAYEPAIRRWERVLNRPAPDPLQDGKLSPPFVEWMMGLPEGWVDGLSRTAALRCLGNAVVPQQAYAAFSSLLGEAFFSPSQVHSGSITPRDTSKPVEVLRTKAGVLE